MTNISFMWWEILHFGTQYIVCSNFTCTDVILSNHFLHGTSLFQSSLIRIQFLFLEEGYQQLERGKFTQLKLQTKLHLLLSWYARVIPPLIRWVCGSRSFSVILFLSVFSFHIHHIAALLKCILSLIVTLS